MAAEMARSPAAPGLLFTTASVRGFSLASEVVSKLVDRTSLRAQQVGAEVTQKLQQACENVAVQTEVSQGAFQEWKGLMTGILSEEASKIQAELDHASRTVSSWQLQQSAGAAESHAQSQSKSDQHTDLKAHPLSLPQFEMPQLESGWLVEAVQQCFPNIGAPSAWPTSFSVAASSDSMSVSDDEESRTPSSPTSLATQLMTQARHYTNQVAKSPTGETATLHSRDTHAASSGNGLRSIFMTKARQLTGQRFDVSPFSPVSSAERSTFKLGQGGKSSDKKVLQPGQVSLPAPDRPFPTTPVHPPADAGDHHSAAETASPFLAPIKHQPATVTSKVKAEPTRLLPVKDGAAVQSAAFGPAKEAGNVRKPARNQSAQSAAALPVNMFQSKPVVVKNKQAPAAPVKVDVAASPAAATSASSSPQHTGRAATKEHVSSSPAGATSSSSTVQSPAARSSGASTAEPGSSAPTAPSKGPSADAAHFSQPSSTPILCTTASQVPSKASAVCTAPAQPVRPASTAMQSSSVDHKATPSEAGNEASATALENGHTASGIAEQLTSESIELRPSPLDALPAPLHLADTSSQTPQLTGKQPDQNTGKTAAKSVRIIRPEPTPNWRTPRPLTPPPTPVQQGHPLSAIPAAVELDSTVAGGSSAAESVAERPDKALNVDMNGQRENEPLRSQTNTIGSATPSRLAGTDARHVAVSSDSVLGSNSPNRVAEGDATSYGNGRQPTTTAATAAVSDSATIVIDSIPWGPSGAATAEGRTAPTQSSGGGGSTTGGSTGGGGGRSDKPSGDSDNEEGKDSGMSAWQQWWARLLLAGGTVGSVFLLSSRVRQALQTAVASVKAQFTSGEEQHAVVDELESESADEPEGIETNIVVKEGDTAWSIAEEYTGSGTSWPEVVASNSNVDTAKPVAGTTLRVRVRMVDEVCETNLGHLEEVRSVYPDHCLELTLEDGLRAVAQMHWKQDLACVSSKSELPSVAAEAVARSGVPDQPAAVLKVHPDSLPPAHWSQKQMPAQAVEGCQAVVPEAPSNPGSVKAGGWKAAVQVGKPPLLGVLAPMIHSTPSLPEQWRRGNGMGEQRAVGIVLTCGAVGLVMVAPEGGPERTGRFLFFF
ncbi:MAG: hypothetical protein FRX49_01175 [Trebouxia sp. A1-2]|nr:MAG: hypothetical protein FRX49_01175 [Trebouxia sp. A1-2]